MSVVGKGGGPPPPPPPRYSRSYFLQVAVSVAVLLVPSV
jgi:hypothetical protein